MTATAGSRQRRTVARVGHRAGTIRSWWQVQGSNLRRLSRLIYSQIPLATRATCRVCRPVGQRGATISQHPRVGETRSGPPRISGGVMADSSFDIVSKLDRQEADNALNQAAKEIANRYDFKNTGAKIEWH